MAVSVAQNELSDSDLDDDFCMDIPDLLLFGDDLSNDADASSGDEKEW